MRRFLSLLVIACVLNACGKEQADVAPADVEPEKPDHPWDLIPDQPDLVAGRQIYLAECALCHNEGEEGAPALVEAEEWKVRADKGLPVLFDHAINGFIGDDGEMPARGGTDSLSDEEVKNAVRYMLATQES
ncbi:MAG: c-type cytochrome [Verrucomicrobiota bacterium]